MGNNRLLKENGVTLPEYIESYIKAEESYGQTAVIVSELDRVLGVISIADAIRAGIDRLIIRLKELGIRKIVMLTGDNERAAHAIAKKLGIDSYYAELLPEDKVSILKRLQDEIGQTVMVGDGVNDAPALASADLGIAVGGANNDILVVAILLLGVLAKFVFLSSGMLIHELRVLLVILNAIRLLKYREKE